MDIKMNDFVKVGEMWFCRHCYRVPSSARNADGDPQASVSNVAAVWADPERRTITCPCCGITEPSELS